MYKFFLLLISLTLLSASPIFGQIDDTQVLEKEQVPVSDVSLKRFSSCDAMETVLIKYFRENIFSQISMYGNGYRETTMVDDSLKAPAMAEGLGGGGDGGFSQTNVQIAGIDESEVVKTDGNYIYYASNQPASDGYQYVTITRATPANAIQLVKRIKLPTNYNDIQLYVADNTLTILANRWNQYSNRFPGIISLGNGSSTVVVVYDIADPVNPKLTRFYTVDGNLSQSRRDGDYLYVLSQNYISLNIWGPVGVYAKDDVEKYLDTTFDVTNILPSTVDIRVSPDKNITVGGKKLPYSLTRGAIKCNEIEYFLPEKPENTSFLTLSIIPLKGTGDVTRKVIYGDASQFFMSQNSFYIVSNYWKQGGNFPCPLGARCLMPMFRSEQNALIHRFSTINGLAKYVYSVLTPGMPLSQYALNERNGILFTANQKDWTTNGVDVFAIDSTGKLLSKLENVGAEERFQAARYIGDRLYLVTFEQTDPLFVISTANPKSMKILGELVMPGYSTYLHPYDANHLIGIGYDTKENQWGGTVNSGIKIDLYDVSDITKPKQKYSQIYGGMGSSADALWNPRALVWDEGRKVLLFSAQLMEQNPSSYQYTSGWQGLLAIGINKDTGITTNAKISHIDMSGISEKRKTECAQYTLPSSQEKCYTHVTTGEKICLKPQEDPAYQYIPAYCYAENDDSSYLANTLWNFSADFVQRGLFIGNALYTVSPNFVQANNYGGGYEMIKRIENK